MLSNLTELALKLAPELGSSPLYIVGTDEIGPLPPNNCLGFASQYWNEQFAAKLGDKWRGSGPLIALDFAAIEQEAGANVENVLLHEVAHLVPFTSLGDFSTSITPKLIARQSERLAQGLAARPIPGAPDDYHDWKFIRRSLHLYFRASALGVRIPLLNLFRRWWQVWEIHYLLELLPETIAMREATFAEIEATPPPPEFLALWQDNLEHYQSCQRPKDSKDSKDS